jgi:hypothetical protein
MKFENKTRQIGKLHNAIRNCKKCVSQFCRDLYFLYLPCYHRTINGDFEFISMAEIKITLRFEMSFLSGLNVKTMLIEHGIFGWQLQIILGP